MRCSGAAPVSPAVLIIDSISLLSLVTWNSTMTSFMSAQSIPRPSPAARDNRQVWSAQTAIRPKNCHRNHFPARVSQPWLRSCLACKTFLFQNQLECTCSVQHQSMLLNSLKCQKFFETFQQKQFQRNGLDRLFHTYKSFLPRLSSAEQHVAVKSGCKQLSLLGSADSHCRH